jgi:RNA polymerase sigma factor (sigma-70 family)
MQDIDAVVVPDAGLSLAELDDGELLALARLDHEDAYAALFTRYTHAAHRLARHLGQREEAEDVVSESFAQVLDLVRRGKGPDRAFRAYLFTTIRHEAGRRAKARQRVMPTDDEGRIDSVVPFGAGQLDEFEKSAIRAAYESLPERWRTVLWHLDVEGRKPHELGTLLDLRSNSVSALVYRARSGLREAYLQQHVKDEVPADSRSCREVRSKLSAFVRRTASPRDQEKVHAHLESCSSCMAIYLDLQEVNREVGAIVAPAALAVSVVGLAAGSVKIGGVAAFLGHLALLAKGAVVAAGPPTAAAAITTAAVVGVTGSGVIDPPRQPLTAHSAAGPNRPAQHPAVGPAARPSARSAPARNESAPAAELSRPAQATEPVQPAPTAPVETPVDATAPQAGQLAGPVGSVHAGADAAATVVEEVAAGTDVPAAGTDVPTVLPGVVGSVTDTVTEGLEETSPAE